MLYPAELRARGRSRYQRWPSSSKAGMTAAVLADIGGRALIAEVGRGAVIIGEGSGHEAGSVIVQEADRIGQRVVIGIAQVAVMIAMIVAGFRQTGHEGGCRQGNRDGEKL